MFELSPAGVNAFDMAAAATMLVVVWLAAWTDLTSGKVPNAVVVAGAMLGLTFSVIGCGVPCLGRSVAGLLLGMSPFLAAFLLRAGGGGDAKLMGAVGALLGFDRTFSALIFTFLAGGIFAVGWLFYGCVARNFWPPRARLRESDRLRSGRPHGQALVQGMRQAVAGRMPFAPAIATGSSIALFWPQ